MEPIGIVRELLVCIALTAMSQLSVILPSSMYAYVRICICVFVCTHAHVTIGIGPL